MTYSLVPLSARSRLLEVNRHSVSYDRDKVFTFTAATLLGV